MRDFLKHILAIRELTTEFLTFARLRVAFLSLIVARCAVVVSELNIYRSAPSVVMMMWAAPVVAVGPSSRSGHFSVVHCRCRTPMSCVSSGIPEAIVRQWVGHVDREVTKLYTHIADEASQAAMQRLAEANSRSSAEQGA
jgi:hypothetical protein